MGKGFFITGTGTGIGKTFVTCMFIRQLKKSGKDVMAIKPVISGWEENASLSIGGKICSDAAIENDTMQIISSLGLNCSQENIQKISPWRFKAPLAPSMAARAEGEEIDYSKLVSFCKNSLSSHEYLLCEGAGGAIVPLNKNKTTLDLICDIGFPAILVTGSYLGSISHTLTAVKSLESKGIKIHAIIVNESEGGVSLEDTIAELKNFISYPTYPLKRFLGNGFSSEEDKILQCLF